MKKERMIELLREMGKVHRENADFQQRAGYDTIAEKVRAQAAVFYDIANMLEDTAYAKTLEGIYLNNKLTDKK